MSCRFASRTDEYHGWKCSETDGACAFFLPDENRCYAEYGEGPLAFEEESNSEENTSVPHQTVVEYVEELVKMKGD